MNNLTKNKWLLLLLGVLLLSNITLLLSFFVFGERTEPARKSPQAPISGYLSQELGFSEEQQSKLKALKSEHFSTLKPLWEEIRKTKDSLYHQLNNETFGETDLVALTARLAEKNKTSDEKVFRYFREMRKICTPEQQIRFDTIVPSMLNKKDAHGKGPHNSKK